MEGKYTALDVADFFVGLANSLPNSSIDNLKLNKLCYYAQGWSLAKFDRPLFNDTIEAWEYGPVIPSVYHTYKVCGNNPISEPSEVFDEAQLDSDELSLLIDVYLTYGKYASWELASMTHEQGAPWHEVFIRGANRSIPLKSIQEYFRAHEQLVSLKPVLTKENTIEYGA